MNRFSHAAMRTVAVARHCGTGAWGGGTGGTKGKARGPTRASIDARNFVEFSFCGSGSRQAVKLGVARVRVLEVRTETQKQTRRSRRELRPFIAALRSRLPPKTLELRHADSQAQSSWVLVLPRIALVELPPQAPASWPNTRHPAGLAQCSC
jgi:hypothetical protein